jgi:hypothetical protein
VRAALLELAPGETRGAGEALGAGGALAAGEADEAGADAEGGIDGEGDTEGATVGGGVGRRPTGSGPTKTKAARTPAATRTPASRPARIVTPVFMRREGTSTDGPGRHDRGRC